MSAKTTQLKKKPPRPTNITADKAVKNDQSNYSDSDYFELSQKFSTVTDPKTFRCTGLGSRLSNHQSPQNPVQ
jgi:hypothetical protein